MHTHHHHDHAHPHGAPKDFGRAFVIAITLNLGFTAVEFVYGFLAQSSALMADAGHNLSDVLGLVLAWGGAMLARAPEAIRLGDVVALLEAGVLNRTKDGIEFPFEAVHVDFTLQAAA